MPDPRYNRLAAVLLDHSVGVEAGDKVLIEATDTPPEFVCLLIREIAARGGLPMVSTYSQSVLRALYSAATEEQMRLVGQVERARMEASDCYIGVRGSLNISELSDVPPDRLATYEKFWWKHVHSDCRVPRTRWVVLRWPNGSMAQGAGMSTESFEDFYFKVCAEVDYGAMASAAEPLRELMSRTDEVRIVGPGTDLRFSVRDIGAVPCSGDRNIPDGETFTCPVRDSIEGHIQFNCETLYRGTVFNRIRLAFRKGRIEEAEAGSQTGALTAILDADEGARYVGEWSLGFNPYILHPMRDILFDEKIAGSFHLTPGQAYAEADNGNRSQIHWDMVCIQRPEYGGGEIRFDGQLVRKDGLFVPEALQGLNPDRLGSPGA